MKFRVVLFILLASLVSVAQDKSAPLTVTNVKMWAKTDSSPSTLTQRSGTKTPVTKKSS